VNRMFPASGKFGVVVSGRQKAKKAPGGGPILKILGLS
jgi:hypothetical protein